MAKKKLMYDTNALMDLGKHVLNEEFCIPWTVLREIEDNKRETNPIPSARQKAMRASRVLMESYGFYTVFPEEDADPNVLKKLPKGKNDSIIAAVAFAHIDEVILVTNDVSLWNLATNLGVECVSVKNLHLLTSIDEYRGYRSLTFTNSQMARFYENPTDNRYHCRDNEYVVIQNRKKEVVDILVWRGDKFEKAVFNPVQPCGGDKVKPRNLQQKMAFDMISNPKLTIKVLTGRYGTGKDFIMAAHAAKAIEKGRFQKIVWVRNNVAVQDTKDLGALPGDEIQKLLPYVMPLADQVGGEEAILQMIEDHTLEVQPLQSIRGRSFKNSIIFCSEAENLTVKQVQLIIGRAGENSQVWLNGDYRQSDSAVFANNSGLIKTIEKMAGQKLFGYVKLETCERSETAALADLLDE